MALRPPVSRTFHVFIGSSENYAMPSKTILEFSRYPDNTCGRIEENDHSYHCMHIFWGLNAYIAKDTVYGQALAKMIKNIDTNDIENMEKRGVDHIREWLCEVMVKCIDVRVLDQKIKTLVSDSYTVGKRNAQANMRDALGFPSDMV
jgi:hypothetical protein